MKPQPATKAAMLTVHARRISFASKTRAQLMWRRGGMERMLIRLSFCTYQDEHLNVYFCVADFLRVNQLSDRPETRNAVIEEIQGVWPGMLILEQQTFPFTIVETASSDARQCDRPQHFNGFLSAGDQKSPFRSPSSPSSQIEVVPLARLNFCLYRDDGENLYFSLGNFIREVGLADTPEMRRNLRELVTVTWPHYLIVEEVNHRELPSATILDS